MENRKTVGLSLGAGASRGFAHIGVLKTFIKHGIPIDIITGTSMGALVAGLYAAGNDIGYIEDLANNISMSKIMDFSIKDGGFLKGKRAEELLRDYGKQEHRTAEDPVLLCGNKPQHREGQTF